MRRALVLAALAALAGCREPGGSETREDPAPPRASSVSAPDAVPPAPPAPSAPWFVDVAAEVGLDVVTYCGGPDKDHILESVGSGAAFLDYDGDGRLDVYVVNAWALDEDPSAVRIRGRNRLYRNAGDGR